MASGYRLTPDRCVHGEPPSTCDDCAALSRISEAASGASASSPEPITPFPHGIFLGTAAATRFGFDPKVERVDDSTLKITYRYPLEGDAAAAPGSRAVHLLGGRPVSVVAEWARTLAERAHDGGPRPP